MSEYILVSDIHGNAPALQEVVDVHGPDAEYVVLGDIHGLNAYPSEVMSLLGEMNTRVVLAGNHDKAIFEYMEGHVTSEKLSKFERDFTLDNLDSAQKRLIESLPHMEVWQDGDSRIAAAHAKPWPEQASGYETGNAGVPEGNIPHFASIVADDYNYVFTGHTHEQYSLNAERWGHDVHLINPGSLGWDYSYATVNTETETVELLSVESQNEKVKAHVQNVLPDGAPHTESWF